MDEREASDRFFLLVEEFRLAGWIGLGKIRRPEGEDAHPDLALARHAIDTLGMLEVKTRGNRSDPEERLLRQTLADLRLNFADEVKRQKEGAQPGEPGPESPEPASQEPPSPGPATPGPESPAPETSRGESPIPAASDPGPESPEPATPGQKSPGAATTGLGQSSPAAGSQP